MLAGPWRAVPNAAISQWPTPTYRSRKHIGLKIIPKIGLPKCDRFKLERFTLPHLRFMDSEFIPRNELGIRASKNWLVASHKTYSESEHIPSSFRVPLGISCFFLRMEKFGMCSEYKDSEHHGNMKHYNNHIYSFLAHVCTCFVVTFCGFAFSLNKPCHVTWCIV